MKKLLVLLVFLCLGSVAHKAVADRDIKPESVIVEPSGPYAGHPYRDSLAAMADTGSALPAPAEDSSAAPVDSLHDPISSPGAAWDDVKAAKKVGWAALVFAVLVMLAKVAARFGKPDSWLAQLGKGKVAVVIGAAGALGAACYNAVATGGAWTAMLVAGVVALGHYLDAEKPAEVKA